MKVVSIVVTYNGAPWILQCLSSLIGSSLGTHIVVVDNASTDHSRQLVAQFPEVEMIALEENAGFGVANNIGLSRALRLEADYVLLLNQDAWVAVDTIEQLVSLARQYPEFGVLSPLHWNAEGTQLDANFASNLARDNPSLAGALLRDEIQPSTVASVSFINAAIWLLSRRCIEVVGGFDPLFFMYGEDNDYCQRVRWHGLKIGVALNTSAYHARGKISSKNSWWQSIKRRSVLAESLLIMILKRVERPLLRRLLGSAYFVVKSSFVALIKLDTIELFALWMAIVRTIPKLVAIMQHRQSSLQSGLHWIDP